MAAYILRRILWTLPVMLAVASITFVLMHSVPGGPWDGVRPVDPGAKERLDEYYGLDQPVWQQFGSYLINLGRGDLGVSYDQRNRPVRNILAEKIQPSLTIGLLALTLGAAVGVPLGVAAAMRPGSVLDYATVAFATVAASIPSLILGMLLLALFSGHYHWLPTSGWGSAKQLVLPVASLSLLPIAYISRITRSSMLDVLNQDYIRTARAKGLPLRTVLSRHMFKNALIPILTVIGPLAAVLVTGSFIVEQLFAIPGVGFAYVSSITSRDYGMIMGTTLFYAFTFVVANLVVDILCAFVDPRVTFDSHG